MLYFGDVEADDVLDRGRAAYARRSWVAAYESLTRVERVRPLEPDDLWRLAMAAWLIGRDRDFLSALERAHRRHLADGAAVDAARCAFWLGFA
ncbi:MAG: DNA-binding response regulator, partial [Longimicrobiales bacterium]